MGRRSRRRAQGSPPPGAPATSYEHLEHGTLVLRGALSPATRAEYRAIASGEALRPGAAREDAWHRQVEFLFERLAESWEVAGVPTTGQRELLTRLRVATGPERAWVRDVLREHLAEWFPDVEAP